MLMGDLLERLLGYGSGGVDGRLTSRFLGAGGGVSGVRAPRGPSGVRGPIIIGGVEGPSGVRGGSPGGVLG